MVKKKQDTRSKGKERTWEYLEKKKKIEKIIQKEGAGVRTYQGTLTLLVRNQRDVVPRGGNPGRELANRGGRKRANCGG